MSRAAFHRIAMLSVTVIGLAGAATTAPPTAAERGVLERGRFLVTYGGCNECHTPGWVESDGRLPASRWMTGSTVGFRGPWGTIYPANVRLWFRESSEADWLHAVETRGGHPPMKWTDLRALSIADRRAIYRFIRSLGPAGTPAPNDLQPGVEPNTPYLDVIPRLPAGRSPQP
jgi:mono/diheme cytochrome c family protein